MRFASLSAEMLNPAHPCSYRQSLNDTFIFDFSRCCFVTHGSFRL